MRIIYSILLLTFISGHLFAQRSETVQTNDSTFSVIINTALCSWNWNGIRDSTRWFVRGWSSNF